jgi:cellulose synthase/poly-beta-1,6-N-acetylglucosamine synthase-like glycosyltransferase
VTIAVCVALVLLAIPSAFFVLEIVAALPPAHRLMSLSTGRTPSAAARVAVLVPAHDEAGGIAAALATITAQLRGGDRLLVVADNCSDDTAAVARAAGAEVVERRDPARPGKGWALAAGVDALAGRAAAAERPPEGASSDGAAAPRAGASSDGAAAPGAGASNDAATAPGGGASSDGATAPGGGASSDGPAAPREAVSDHRPAARPPDVVIIVDADCRVAPGTVDALRAAAQAAPAQASYLMRAPDGAPRSRRLAELMFVVRNHARPLGLARIGAPCLFTGAGMAMPWSIARTAPFATGSVVEDVQLAIDLAVAGTPPCFCPEAQVTSVFPSAERAAAAQRARWLWGNLRTLQQAPRLVVAAIRQSRLGLLSLALELIVPPLSLLFPLWLLVAGAALAVGLTSSEWRPGIAAAVWIAACASAVLAAWWRFARDRVPFSVVAAAPFYALPAIGSALTALVRRRQRWNRTARD